MKEMYTNNAVAVVIPCYKVERHILPLLDSIGSECMRIYVVDDCCPNQSGALVLQHNKDPRVVVLRNPKNLGVGGAVMRGYREALKDGMDVLVKLDGDGQMDPALIPLLIAPIVEGRADYTKGNRFFNLEKLYLMPKMRIFGNGLLSFMTKFSSGYWDIFDPTNGFTAIHGTLAQLLPFDKISSSYFFETDMLFRLNTLRAVVQDVPMDAVYKDEVSHLKISKITGEFFRKHVKNCCKRIFYNYYLRDMSLASFELPLGLVLLTFALLFGGFHWASSYQKGAHTPPGTIMLAAVPLLIGIQCILAFIAQDVASVPRQARHKTSKK